MLGLGLLLLTILWPPQLLAEKLMRVISIWVLFTAVSIAANVTGIALRICFEPAYGNLYELVLLSLVTGLVYLFLFLPLVIWRYKKWRGTFAERPQS